jgi:ribosomal 50S subunit-recycling heat shock protein
MRLDKFLKLSRIIKRRPIANEACGLERVFVNGKPSKPAKQLAIGDVISVRFGDKEVSFKVKELPLGNVSKDKAESLYEPI